MKLIPHMALKVPMCRRPSESTLFLASRDVDVTRPELCCVESITDLGAVSVCYFCVLNDFLDANTLSQCADSTRQGQRFFRSFCYLTCTQRNMSGHIYKWGSNPTPYKDGPNFLLHKDRVWKRLQPKANIFISAVNPLTVDKVNQPESTFRMKFHREVHVFLSHYFKYCVPRYSTILGLYNIRRWVSATCFGRFIPTVWFQEPVDWEAEWPLEAALTCWRGTKFLSLSEIEPCRLCRSQPFMPTPAPLIRLQYAFTTGTVRFTSSMCHCWSWYAHVRTPRVES
jgi:hypothetical protein